MINSFAEFLAFDYAYNNGYSTTQTIAFVEKVIKETTPRSEPCQQDVGFGFVCYRGDMEHWDY